MRHFRSSTQQQQQLKTCRQQDGCKVVSLGVAWLLLFGLSMFHVATARPLFLSSSLPLPLVRVNQHQTHQNARQQQQKLLHVLLNTIQRGGSTAAFDQKGDDKETGMVDDDDDDEKEEDNDEEEEETEKDDKDDDNNGNPIDAVIPKTPVQLSVQTKWGNELFDYQMEITTTRTKNIAAVKKSIARLLPGRPPNLALELVYEGSILDEEALVDELFDEGDEEEEDDDENDEDDDGVDKRTLILNIVPPVDPKFGSQLTNKLSTNHHDSLPTDELLDAFFLNQAAVYHTSQKLMNPSSILKSSSSSPMLRLDVQQQAKILRDQFQARTPEAIWQAAMEKQIGSQASRKGERRGQRYRSGKGGAVSSLKTSIQRNLNINWIETIWYFILLKLCARFGGRQSFSQRLMSLCAPMCFIIQSRPVKVLIKQLFYACLDPPAIVLGLLPAPQQAILDMDSEKAFQILYGKQTNSTDTTLLEEDDDGASKLKFSAKPDIDVTSKLKPAIKDDDDEYDDYDDDYDGYDDEYDDDDDEE